MKKFQAGLALVFVLLMVLSVPAAAQGTGKSYVYDHNAEVMEIPDPYSVTKTIGYDFGFRDPVDMQVLGDQLFVLDAGRNAVVKNEAGNTEAAPEATPEATPEENPEGEAPEGEAAEGEGETAAANTVKEGTKLVVVDKNYQKVSNWEIVWKDNVNAEHKTAVSIEGGEITFSDPQGLFPKFSKEVFGEAAPFAFKDPRGLWVAENRDKDKNLVENDPYRIYIAERGQHAIFVFNVKGELLDALGKPNTPMMDHMKPSEYLPIRVLTDHLGYLYIRAENEYRGFVRINGNMEADDYGEFYGYFGSNTVTRTADAITLRLFSRFMTEAQLSRLQQLVPMGYSNLCIDKEGDFIYGVRGSTEDMNELIRKLNCKSKNVLDYKERFGDYNLARVGVDVKTTSFNAITVDEKGFITAFDSTWQRLFQYNAEGNLMYVFGGKGTQKGTFTNGVDIDSWGDNLLVLDNKFRTITVMSPTTFGANVRGGEYAYGQGDYDQSKEYFAQVAEECMNYEFAYSGIGKALYMNGQYKEAMDNFYLAHDQDNYSMAFKMYRAGILRSLTVPMVIAVVVLIVILIVVSILKKKGIIKEKKLVLDESGKLKYVLHTIIHPIEGYEEMRYNKKYSFGIANVAVFFFFFSTVIMSLYSGFIFNGKNAQNYNMLFTFVGMIGGFALFVIVNWLMSTFFEGKGKLKEVWIYLAYATIPYSVTSFLYTILSNVLTAEEATFLGYLEIIGVGWALVMALFALQGVHMYSLKKNIVSILVTLLGMAVVIFIVFLMFNLFIQFFSFVESIYTELMYRTIVGF